MDTALNREALLEGQKKHWSAATPMGRMGRPDELNGLAVFLASGASGFVTGAEILADVSFFFGKGVFLCVMRLWGRKGKTWLMCVGVGRLCGVLSVMSVMIGYRRMDGR